MYKGVFYELSVYRRESMGVSQSGPVDKLTFSVFISSYFLKCYKKAGKFGYLNHARFDEGKEGKSSLTYSTMIIIL